MNKSLKLLAAATLIALTTAACQKEKLFDSQTAGEETVTFTVKTDAAATKATADNDGLGAGLTRCLVAVYMKTADPAQPYKLYDTPATTGSGLNYTFTVNLIRKQTYQIVVWADKGETVYDVNEGLTLVTRKTGDVACNSDAYDAFYASTEFVQGTTTSTAITAKRPFAQLNLITKDLNENFQPGAVSVTYSSPQSFNPFDGTVSADMTEVTYKADSPYYNTATVTTATQHTLVMNYLFAAEGDQTILPSVKMTAKLTVDAEIEVANVPVRRNYRTNIIGNLLTEQTDYTITVDPVWSTPETEMIAPGLWKVDGVYEVSAAEGLCYASANIFAQSGGEFVLTEDIDMTGVTSVVTRASGDSYTSALIGASAGTLVIDGNGHKISNLPGMLISRTGNANKVEIKNLTLENPTVVYDLNDELTGADQAAVGAFVGFASTSDEIIINNCHINGGYIKGGHWTGGFVGYACGYNNQSDGPVFEKLTISNCSISDAEVYGKGSVGGIIGHATGDVATLVKIESPKVLRNTITSVGSSTNKAGSVVATVGCAGSEAWNGEKGGVYLTSCTVAGNTVKSNNVANTKFWGRQGDNTGKLYIDGIEVTDYGVAPVVQVASVNGVKYTSLSEAISSTTGEVTITLDPGDHTLPTSLTDRTLVIEGTDPDATVIDMTSGSSKAQSVTFKNVTVKRNSGAYGGLQHTGEEHFENSKVYGTIVTYAPVFSAVNTEFYQTDPTNYNVHIYAEGRVSFDGCKFFCAGKSIYAHHEAATPHYISISNCTFNASRISSGKAAIQLHTELGIYGTLDVTNCTATGFDSTINGGLWNELNNTTKVLTDKFVKTIDGQVVVRTDAGFASALALEKESIDILVNGNVAADVAPWDYPTNIKAFGGECTQTINIKGATGSETVTFNNTNNDWNHIALKNQSGKLTISNVKLTNSGYNDGPWNRHDVVFGCEVSLKDVVSDKAIGLKKKSVLENVTIADTRAEDDYGLWITAEGQTVTVKDCLLDMVKTNASGRCIKIADQYVTTPKSVVLNVSGTTFKSQKKAAVLVTSTAGAEINWGEGNDITNVAADQTNAVWNDSDRTAAWDLVTVTGCTKHQE